MQRRCRRRPRAGCLPGSPRATSSGPCVNPATAARSGSSRPTEVQPSSAPSSRNASASSSAPSRGRTRRPGWRGSSSASSTPLPRRSPMKIALVAPPMVAVPPRRYAGTERVVAALGDGFTARGHEVTLFAPGDSEVSYDLVPTVPKALWGIGDHGDATAWFERTIELVARESDQFDVIHSHLDVGGFPLVRRTTTPVVSTLHGRLDAGDTPGWLAAYPDAALIAISASQRRWFPDHRWL